MQRAAASDFVTDINRVTGTTPALKNVSAADIDSLSSRSGAVIIGTLGHSALLDAVVNNAQLNVSVIDGQWES